ncbi:MAG: hypothetical protein LBO69_04680 [Ignavibacteria bacterium]|jgi:hypothetical protein|nr:hypothetical protein [Ignavibacteria bacterium]
MKFFKIYLCLIALAAMFLYGCGDDEATGYDTELAARVETLYQEIKNPADSILLSENPDWTALAEQYRDNELVKEVEANDEHLMIEFSNGEVVGWVIQPEYLPVDWDAEAESITKIGNAKIENSLQSPPKALIVNPANEEDRKDTKNSQSLLSIAFAREGWNVSIKLGKDADINFFKSGLSGYDAIFVIAHGQVFAGRTWILTGEIVQNTSINSFDKKLDRARIWVKTKDGKIEPDESESVYAISNDFISTSYSPNSFPNSIVYLVCCHGLQCPTQMGQALIDKGAKVVVGWDETNCLGDYSGYKLFEYMLDKSSTLTTGINYLKSLSRKLTDGSTYTDYTKDIHQKGNPPRDVNLVYYPTTAGNYTLPAGGDDEPADFFADFNNNVFDNNAWIKDAINPNDIRVEDGVMKLEQNYTDQRTHLKSKTFGFVNNELTLQRDVYLHYGSSYGYANTNFCFNNSDTIYIRYQHTYYYGSGTQKPGYKNQPRIGIYLYDLNHNRGKDLDSNVYLGELIEDNWFTEKIVINKSSNTLKYYLNNTLVKEISLQSKLTNINISNANGFNLVFDPYGWWTGHKHYFDNFSIKNK